MRFRDFKIIFEQSYTAITADELEGMKAVIASKIKQLPDSDATAKALKEIEELLQHVNAGGRMGIIYDQLEQINDPSVLAAQKMLARYILSIDASVDQRKEFFKEWKSDNIVRLDKLLSKEKVDFSQVFNLYNSNKMAKEFIDDVMEVSALGQGRGEFGLNVLSKSIWAPEDQKGDLKVRFGKKVLQVECKTTMGGSARFSDQEIRPAQGYEAVAIELNNFVSKNKTYPIKLPEYGLNLNKAIEFYQNIKPGDQSKFIELVRKTVTLIFGGKKVNVSDIKSILDNIKSGDNGAALQAWSKASFNYYMTNKEDDGVLYTDLNDKTFLFYENADDLTKQGLRFHARTPYLSTIKDLGRGVYPQLEIKTTTFGGEAARKNLPKPKRTMTPEEFDNKMFNWSKTLASRRGITDLRVVRSITNKAKALVSDEVDSADIIAELENLFPGLRPPTYQSTNRSLR
jgi:hypothetical protein